MPRHWVKKAKIYKIFYLIAQCHSQKGKNLCKDKVLEEFKSVYINVLRII